MFASRTADFDALRLNLRIVQIELGQTRGARNNHGRTLFLAIFRHYDEWNGKNQEQNGGGIHKMSNVKVQSSNEKNNDQSQKSNSLAAQAPKTVNLGFEIKGIDLTLIHLRFITSCEL
jgi:hypothetical protein